MQQLLDILAYKLRLTNNKSADNLSNKQKDELLDQLIIEKKKQMLRMLVQNRLQQSIDSRRFSSSQDLRNILEQTYKVMSVKDQTLQLPRKQDPLQSIVELYINFFKKQNCMHRAQQISNIHHKKLCPKGLLPSTLLNWFVQWTRKLFQEYLKTTIHSLYVNAKYPRSHSINKEQNQQQAKPSADPSFLVIKKKPALPSFRTIVATSHNQKRKESSLDFEDKTSEKIRLKSQSPSEHSLRLKSINLDEPHEDILPINKQIFFNAYQEQFQILYKSLQNCMPDLDYGFVRNLKRGGRRREVKKRIKEVANNLIKHMNHIKQGIQSYYQYYHNAHTLVTIDPQKHFRKKNKQKTQRSESPNRTSQGVRSISKSRYTDDRRTSTILALTEKQYRYSSQIQQVPSNLLPCFPKRQIKSKMINQSINKSIEISLTPRGSHESKILFLNAGNLSAHLQIIQQKGSKVKSKGQKHHSKKPRHKNRLSKSIDTSIQSVFSSLPVTIDLAPAQHLRLPKIRKFK